MDFVVNAWTWLHGQSASGLIVDALAISGAFAHIAQFTPWAWDDQAAGIVQKVIAFLAGNLGTSKGQ